MADDPSWDDIFASQPPTDDDTREPGSRRARRDAEAGRSRTRVKPPRDPKPRRSKAWIIWLVSVLAVVGLVAGAGVYVWSNYEEQVRKVLGWELPPEDYDGTGTGEATVIIKPGDGGTEITRTLLEAGVIKSFDAFYDLLLADPQLSFFPGFYILAERMSAQAALDALQDPANRYENTALIQEGKTTHQIYDILEAATGIPASDYRDLAEDHARFGVPAEAPSIEGYLFPATYTFDPDVTADQVLTTLVTRMFQSLDAAGVAPEDRHRVLTISSLIQREAGGNRDDFFKVSRVIQNRLSADWKLEFDSTSHYGYAWAHGERLDDSVFTSSAELQDDNPYNTYVHTGLPIGPIGAPGDLAIEAALSPADGPWYFFVTVNLDTGETVFSESLGQHEAAVNQLRQWCRETQSPNCG